MSIHLEGPPDMNDDVSDLLSDLSRQFKAELRRAARTGEVQPTPFQGDVLAYLGRNPGANLYTLAEQTGRDRGQTTRVVADLEALGLVTRERPADDRRFVSVRLTTRGNGIYRRVLAKRAELAAIMLESFTAEERRLLMKMLARMRSNLRTNLG
jgi:DNA-binding MarR family transcriptional regulator